MKKILLILAILFSTNSLAIEFTGKFVQGHFILGKTQIGAKIKFVNDSITRKKVAVQGVCHVGEYLLKK